MSTTANYNLTEEDNGMVRVTQQVFGVESDYEVSATELESNLGGPHALGGFIPPGVFWLSPGNGVCLYHERSSQKTLWIRRGELNEGEGHINDYEHENWVATTIWLPALCYLLSLDPYWPRVQALWLVYVDEHITSDWALSYLPIPNISSETGVVCGSDYIAPPRRPETISEAVAYALDGFWSSAFNYDRDDFKNSAFMKRLKVLRRQQDVPTVWDVWENMSLLESHQALVAHCPRQVTVSEIIEEQLAVYGSGEAVAYRFLTQLFPPRY